MNTSLVYLTPGTIVQIAGKRHPQLVVEVEHIRDEDRARGEFYTAFTFDTIDMPKKPQRLKLQVDAPKVNKFWDLSNSSMVFADRKGLTPEYVTYVGTAKLAKKVTVSYIVGQEKY